MGHAPLEVAVEHLAPLAAEGPAVRVVRVVPVGDLLQQGPLGHVEVGLELLVQVEGKDQLHGLPEDLLQVEVDAPRGAVIVDVGVEVEPGVQEHDERLDPAAIEGEALLAEEGVVHDPLDVDRPHRDPAHVGVAQHVVHVVGGVDAGEQRLQVREPARVLGGGHGVALAHQVADPLRVDALPVLEGPARAAPQAADEVAQLLPNDPLADFLVGEVEVGEEVVVEEVAEGPVAHVVEQPRHPHQLLEERRGGRVGELGLERPVELEREAPREVHRPQGVLEAAVLRGREDPPRRLQLRHPAQPLHPRGVDQVLLGRLAGRPLRPGIEDVLVDRIGDETAALVGVDTLHG